MARRVESFPAAHVLFRNPVRGSWRLLRELVGAIVLLAIWMALWTWAAATLTQPWAPDPETRAAMVERA